MPVFFKGSKRVLFIHVPKAGGTSMEIFFEANGFKTAYLDRGGSPDSLNPTRRCSPQHMHAALLESLFDITRFDYVFMVVRHPMRRLLSKFIMENRDAQSVEQLENWILTMFSKVFDDSNHMDNHFRPQCDFLVTGADVLRLEDGFGSDVVARFEARTGLAFAQKNIGREMHARTTGPDIGAIKPDIRAMIKSYYQKDFEIFGYE